MYSKARPLSVLNARSSSNSSLAGLPMAQSNTLPSENYTYMSSNAPSSHSKRDLVSQEKLVASWKKVRAAKDKEGLQEEQLQLSRVLNQLREENQDLIQKQQQISIMHEKLANYILQIEHVVMKRKGPKISQPQSWLVLNLKSKLEQIRESIEEKDVKVETNKRDPVFLKRQEHEIIMSIYGQYNELIEKEQSNLRRLQYSNTYTSDSQFIDANEDEEDIPIEEFEKLSPRSMRKNVSQLQTNFAIIREENDLLQVKRDSLNKKTTEQQKLIFQFEGDTQSEFDRISDLQSQLQEYREPEEDHVHVPHRVTFKHEHNPNSPHAKSYSEQIKEFQANERNQIYLQQQKHQIDVQTEQIASLQAELHKLKSNYEQEKKSAAQKKIELTRELNQLKKVCSISQLEEQKLLSELKNLNVQNFPPSIGKTIKITQNILQKQDEKKVPKVPRIESEDIKRIAKELNFRLRLKKVPIEYAIRIFIPSWIKQNGFTSVEYIMKKLREDPFNIPTKQESLMLARFLVEDNSENMIELNLGRKCHYKVTRSILKSIIGRVLIYKSEEEEHAVWNRCFQEVDKNQVPLKQFGEANFLKKGGDSNCNVTQQQIIDAFVYVSHELESEEMNYVLLRLFELTSNINSLPFFAIFDIFKESAWKPLDLRAKNSLIFKPSQVTQILDSNMFASGSEDDS